MKSLRAKRSLWLVMLNGKSCHVHAATQRGAKSQAKAILGVESVKGMTAKKY